MEYRKLGKTGLKVSPIGMGGIGAMGKYGPVSPEQFADTMARASQFGLNFLDTAPGYGESEAVFGHYLKDHRQDWTVCTKIGTCGDTLATRFVVEQCDQSLARLRVDHLDLLLIHSIDQYGDGEGALGRVRETGMLDAMKGLQREGKVSFIGVSGQLSALVPAVASGEFDVALTYNSYNLLIREAEEALLPLAEERNVGVVLGGAFYQGLLTGLGDRLVPEKGRWFEKEDPGLHQTDTLVKRVRALRKMVGGDARALTRLALRFALSDPRVSVVVSGMSRPEEVEENAAAVEAGPLSETERTQIDEALATVSGQPLKWR